MSRAGQASRGGCPGRREQPAQRPGEDAHHVQEARSLLSHPAQSGFHPRALGSHSRFWTRKSGSLSSVDFQKTLRVPGGDAGGQRAGRGPHGREGGPGGECFLSCLLRSASQMPSRELPMADGLRRLGAQGLARSASRSACESGTRRPHPGRPAWPVVAGVPRRWPGAAGQVAGQGLAPGPFQRGAILFMLCAESG